MGIIGMILMLVGFANAAWIFIWYLLTMSARLGTNLSKNTRFENEKTDEYIEQGKSFSNDLLVKLMYRLAIGGVGFLLYYFAS